MHVRCFCHKLALVVNAGLKALSLETLPPGKAKESVLGFFPVLGKLIDEEEPEESKEISPVEKTVPHVKDYDAGSKSDYGNADEEVKGNPIYSDNDSDDPNSISQPQPAKHAWSTRLQELTQKLEVVVKQITRSVAQRAHFQWTAEKLNIKVAPLIAALPEKLARMASSKFLSDAAIQLKLKRAPPSELLTHSNSAAQAFGHQV
ncbi:hypothetical protein PCANC_24406 [Puccinia coronata f. sp. avenae]|uniref:HAT C-terminal dimerisation domain-containing protein n=1 Tax=Puccinia coronata f. sp. avenae TaxID=200324 RepID=A0A2N5SAA1_9BASI|nr:hypothetical protein PCANC_24406 [Puccinia coronata f. sp. avenae]